MANGIKPGDLVQQAMASILREQSNQKVSYKEDFLRATEYIPMTAMQEAQRARIDPDLVAMAAQEMQMMVRLQHDMSVLRSEMQALMSAVRAIHDSIALMNNPVFVKGHEHEAVFKKEADAIQKLVSKPDGFDFNRAFKKARPNG